MAISFSNPVLDRSLTRLHALLKEKSYQEKEVVLSSGKKSNFYIDCKQSSLHADGHLLIGQLFASLIHDHAPACQAVGGLSMGADPLASATSMASTMGGRPLHAFLIRKEAKGHGTEAYVEGMSNLGPGMPVVILEDVVTTGASTIKAIERAKAVGLDVKLALALVDRDEGGREKIVEHAPLLSLFSPSDFTN